MENTDFTVNYSIKEIQKIIPHRYPFLLIDKVTYMEPGKKVTAYKNVTMNEYFFQGHFPEEPVMPGVLIIEALAQAGAVAILSEERFKGKIAFFGGINKAKFRKKVVPGDTLRLEVEIIKIKGPAGIGNAVAYVDDKKAAEAEIMFMIGDKN
ncbi:3-hydroxyacyl-ACP dehydratase FabZ [Clostridium sp. CX1]|uniref:3-hydroxyacyl-[acyl-carrier-protein] dehydratase FabZ n=1 Tax=Clostridium tanneri TaxID=3037988 RepID=A0ABU4JTV6_9CLOT|nr:MULTISPECIES: 3-hydroxyacyl-ACP dehydratase FabZ [unclassified Clostridium]MCT8977567.1 3-hydroxyacyl-ACP dehydratase FabZ [Clostridium sp. CX1]MDW8801594.1 3-hydroxyacyl-ACP dehydratase FabZ [Clostridium sp. A1-XYC3]